MSKPYAFNRAAADAQVRRKANAAVYLQAAAQGLPTSSWWTDLDRAAFAERVKREALRMSFSSLGNNAKLMTGRDTEKVERE
jgi:hypothetical protein